MNTSAITPWVEPHVRDLHAAVVAIEDAAVRTAGQLTVGPVALCVLEPRDGYSYAFVVTWIKAHPAFGNTLLVSLPEFNRCLFLDPHGFHVPGYIDEKLVIGPGRAAVIAAYTTLLSDALTVAVPA